MKVLVIGGTGHVGGHMIPQLIDAGCEVLVASRSGKRRRTDGAWSKVKTITCGITPDTVPTPLLNEKPDVVIDMPGTAKAVYDHFKGITEHIIACGSLWMFGAPTRVPTPEIVQGPCPFDAYAQRFADIQAMIQSSTADGVAFTAIMPPNICGPGKIPLDGAGGRSIDLHKQHAAGAELILPDGPAALIGPCDAEDIARCFTLAVMNRDKAAGEIFNVGSAYALTAETIMATLGDIYGTTIPIKTVSWEHYTQKVSPDIGAWWHFYAHMCPDISKAAERLGYAPRYTPETDLSASRGLDASGAFAVKMMKPDIERNLGPQPLADIMAQHGLAAHDLVAASTEQITHKMVARAVKGRRLTLNTQQKIQKALHAACGQWYPLDALFNYIATS